MESYGRILREGHLTLFLAERNPSSSAEYARLKAGGFNEFKLKVGGLVENPVEISFPQLKSMTKQEQVTQHHCIQGWSGIAKWGGVPLHDIVAIVRPKPEAKFAVFFSFAYGPDPGSGLFYDAHRIENMYHTQTILAYEMNGAPLEEMDGAPLRLRDELELGFKQVKRVQAIEFVESFQEIGSGQGGFNEDYEYYGWRQSVWPPNRDLSAGAIAFQAVLKTKRRRRGAQFKKHRRT